MYFSPWFSLSSYLQGNLSKELLWVLALWPTDFPAQTPKTSITTIIYSCQGWQKCLHVVRSSGDFSVPIYLNSQTTSSPSQSRQVVFYLRGQTFTALVPCSHLQPAAHCFLALIVLFCFVLLLLFKKFFWVKRNCLGPKIKYLILLMYVSNETSF